MSPQKNQDSVVISLSGNYDSVINAAESRVNELKEQQKVAQVQENESKLQRKKIKYLILTSSGGGGHTNAAEARKNELKALNIPEDEIAVIDLMGVYPKAINYEKPWVPTYSFLGFDPFFAGSANTEKWNASQKEGTEDAVRRLESLVEMQPLAEAMQADEVHKNLKDFLKENDIQAVYNTQALSNPAICQAVVDYNKEHGKQLEILTTVTDLITHRADHFLGSLRKLSKDQAKILQMEISAAPLCDPGEKEAEFYKKYGILDGLFVPKSSLVIENGEVKRKTQSKRENQQYPSPVKPEYLAEPSEIQKSQIMIKAGNIDESVYLENTLGQAKTQKDGAVDITIPKAQNDKLITITMGSQGSNTVLEYMNEFARQIEENKENLAKGGNVYLCIAAGKNEKNSLYEKVISHAAEIIEEIDPSIKDKIKILPLAFQDAKHMSSLLNNSDVLVTRSGGMSSMEAKATHGRNPNRQVFVHSEAKLKFPENFPKHSYDATYEALMKGTVKWEGGNAEYLLREITASLGSPEVIDFGLSSSNNYKNSQSIRNNSLFHFAYDGKLNNKNLKEIEMLIREGSNPNMRFAGGSYLIDHCQDIQTKLLLVQYGAHLSPKSLNGLNAEEKSELKKTETNYRAKGAPKTSIHWGEEKTAEQLIKENKGYKYLHPLEPRNIIEKMITGMDKVGDFIRNKILRMDDAHDAIDSVRLYLETDPTEQRNLIKRLRQVRNFSFNTIVFIAKQPVNLAIKPLSMTANIIKAGLISFGMLLSEAKEEKSNICNYREFKETSWKAIKDLGQTVVAGASAALVLSGFGAPVALTIGGVSASLSLGAASFGAANAATTGLNSALVQAVAASQSPAANAVLTTEGVVEWGMLRPFMYFALNPKKMFYSSQPDAQGNKLELNALGARVHELHKNASNPEISIEIRRQARDEIKKIQELQVTDKVYAPVLNAVMPSLKTNNRETRK